MERKLEVKAIRSGKAEAMRRQHDTIAEELIRAAKTNAHAQNLSEGKRWTYDPPRGRTPPLALDPFADVVPVDLTTAVPGSAKRVFPSGASRDTSEGKLDYEAFLSPEVLRLYATFMHFNRKMADGSMRAGDNWQKGMPKEEYRKSLVRHVMEVWTEGRAGQRPGAEAGILAAVLFNSMGMLFELIRRFGLEEVEREMLAYLEDQKAKAAR